MTDPNIAKSLDGYLETPYEAHKKTPEERAKELKTWIAGVVESEFDEVICADGPRMEDVRFALKYIRDEIDACLEPERWDD